MVKVVDTRDTVIYKRNCIHQDYNMVPKQNHIELELSRAHTPRAGCPAVFCKNSTRAHGQKARDQL